MRDTFRLVLVSDRSRCPMADDGDDRRRLVVAIESACRAGVRAVQLREKDLDARDLLDLATELRRVTEEQEVRLLINDRVDIAIAAHADGAHCPEQGFSPGAARAILGDHALVGSSCHSLQAVQRAADAGADFVFLGPVFATPSKKRYGAPIGLEALRAACRVTRVPVFAIGGIDPDRAVECVDAGARGVAVTSAILASEDVAAAVTGFKNALGEL
jgi:thiamine-phosphate pyrophosphorylase